MQLLHEGQNSYRHNNIRIKGLPEPEGTEDLQALLQALFGMILESPDSVKLDNAYMLMESRSSKPSIPWVVVCLHQFTVRESLIQRAWHHGLYGFRGDQVSLLPDLSRAILQWRALLWPLLDVIKGCFYRWGFPFHLIVRRGGEQLHSARPC